MRRRVPWRGVPLPELLELRSLAGRMVLPSFRPAALLGFVPSQVYSRGRVDAPSKLGGYTMNATLMSQLIS